MGEGLDDACVGFSAGKRTRFVDISGSSAEKSNEIGLFPPKVACLALGSTREAAIIWNVSVITC
jgi:hypothetical protein